jgi:hypothetical protein
MGNPSRAMDFVSATSVARAHILVERKLRTDCTLVFHILVDPLSTRCPPFLM